MDVQEPIAIVGMGAVFPGATNLEEFWSTVVGGIDRTGPVPVGRWAVDPASCADPTVALADHVYSTRGGFVGPISLEGLGLRLNPGLVDQLDPLFGLVLHAAKQAWDDAKTQPLAPERVGVILGQIVLPTETSTRFSSRILGQKFAEPQGLPDWSEELISVHPLNAFPAGLPAKLVARALGLAGRTFTLDAACASSLYALALAVEELRAGRADAMLAGGLSRPDPLYTQMGFSQLRALSARGTPAPFDAQADGLVVGEGSGMVVLKRLSDALSHGDRIHGVIAGIGLSNDVHGDLLAPNSEGQLRAMRQAYAQAGWSPPDVDLIECHATGTPLGDAVEVESLKTLWQDAPDARPPGYCVIGSAKSNFGHALTAAGSAGLIKVLLALEAGVLPPTANFEHPSPKLGLEASPFRVLKEPEPWRPRKAGQPRRAAISAFGFGGINAHILVEEWIPGSPAGRSAARPSAGRDLAIAVVGISAALGPETSLAKFQARVFEEPQDRGLVGDAIADFSVRLDQFRIPPVELEAMLPQQSLMLKVAQEAIADAIGQPQSALQTGVMIGIGLDLNTTNYQLRWTMPDRVRQCCVRSDVEDSESTLDTWIEALKQAAGPPLTANRTMGALGGVVASRIAREFRLGGPSFSVSDDETSGNQAVQVAVDWLRTGVLDTAVVGAVDFPSDPRTATALTELSRDQNLSVGDAAFALVLKRRDDAIRDGDRIYALIDDVQAVTRISGEQPPRPSVAVSPTEASLIEVSRAIDHGATAGALPYTGAASGMAAVAKTILALYQQVIPGRSSQAGPRFWPKNQADGPRRATVCAWGLGGSFTRIELREFENPPSQRVTAERSHPLGHRGLALFSLEADDEAGLIAQVDALVRLADEVDSSIDDLAVLWWRSTRDARSKRLGAGVVASDRETLLGRLTEARDRFAGGWPRSIPTPRRRDALALPKHGSGDPPRVAFVYPGLGNTFEGMGRALSVLWPEVMRRHEQKNARFADQVTRGTFWDRPIPGRFEDHVDLIVGQVVVGSLVTDIIRLHGVEPDAAIGYSMGETSALVSLGAWSDRDELLRRIVSSPLFRSELAGRSEAARRFWSISDDRPVDWVSGIVLASPDRVRAAIGGDNRLFLLIVNSDQECVVGGQRRAVGNLVARLGCAFIEIPAVSTVHCPIGATVEREYRELHDLPTRTVDLPFYSGVWGQSYRADRSTAAEAITAQAGCTIDFPNVIESAYQDGIRVFIEMGPGGSCSRMIGQILGDRPHLARSACVADHDSYATILQVLAELIAWRVPVDLAPLYPDAPSEVASTSAGSGTSRSKVARSLTLRVGLRAFPSVTRPAGLSISVAPPPTAISEALGESSIAEAPAESPAKVNPPMPTRTNDTLQIPAIDNQVLARQIYQTQAATASAHESFLRVVGDLSAQIAVQAARRLSLSEAGVSEGAVVEPLPVPAESGDTPRLPMVPPKPTEPVALDRDQCLEFAIGSIAKVLGPEYAKADSYPTRVRLPDEPLMLVDRIMTIEAPTFELGKGRVVTEHDIFPGDWYLDADRIAPGIAIESGQADLFLAGYMGIDLITKGLSVYRLLDATVTFHRGLPGPGAVIRYDIRIKEFFRQGETHLFRFEFEGTVDGEPLLTMRDGCAGFFSPEELAAGKGIVPRPLDGRPRPGVLPDDWEDLVPSGSLSIDDGGIEALRRGDFSSAFGAPFDQLGNVQSLGLPSGRMALVHRVEALKSKGGRFGLGMIRAEADIHPGDWFMVCHFVDDRVMPGTLMYESCMQAFRIFLMRLGWVGAVDSVAYEPVPGVGSRLRCRGQVTESTRKVSYEITIKELGYRPEPYAIGDALMYADGKPIVEITDISLQLTGTTRAELQRLWEGMKGGDPKRPVLFDERKLLEFAKGKPSVAFGEAYRAFDDSRFIARLPAPPYQFLSRIVATTAEAWKLEAGGTVEAEYDVPPDAWYFEADRQDSMPFAVLLEIPLQACGWMAAYMGSALKSESDLKFRNLGGTGCQHARVTRNSGTLRIRSKITKVSSSAGMILQHYDLSVHDRSGLVYDGKTYFGFFHPAALAEQVGIREMGLTAIAQEDRTKAQSFDLPGQAPFPDRRWRMIDRVTAFLPDGGTSGLGFIEGATDVDPDAWFFRAHFHQDPVWPGSLGLESLLQLLKVIASARWGATTETEFESVALESPHRWEYRGQITPSSRSVVVQATITARDDERRFLRANGLLSVDGKVIYQMSDFTLRVR